MKDTTNVRGTNVRTLLEIGDDIRALDNLIEEAGGELSRPEVEAAFVALFEQLACEEAGKLDGCVNYIRRLESEVSLARSEADQYLQHARVREARIDRFKRFLIDYLNRTGRTKATTLTGRTVAVQANGGKPPVRLVESIDPATVPDHLVQVKRLLDIEAIRRGLEEGDPDAKKIAMLAERGQHLRIR